MSIETPITSTTDKNRQAEFLVIKYLEEEGPHHIENLESGIRPVIDELNEDDNAPVTYVEASYPESGIRSKALSKAIGRCQSKELIRTDSDGRYQLASMGERYLQEDDLLDYLARKGVGPEFRGKVNDALRRIPKYE